MHSIALAAVSCLRSIAGFGFPLFAPAMYAKLGYGKGDTILACLAVGLGCPACVSFLSFLVVYPDYSFTSLILVFSPFLLWKYGKRIRMSSAYAHKTHMPGGGGANAGDRGNDVAVGAGTNDLEEEKKSNANEEKERSSEESSLRPQPSRKPSHPLSDTEIVAEREGEALVEYDELPVAVQLESAVERLARTMSIQRSDSGETRVVGRRQSRSGER